MSVIANKNIKVQDTSLTLENIANGVIVDSGTNSNGTYIKYSNGIMICTKTISGTAYITQQYYGSFYITPENNMLNFGDYAQTFIERPIVSIQFRGGNPQWLASVQNQSASHIGESQILSVTSKTAGAYYDVIAIGKWK